MKDKYYLSRDEKNTKKREIVIYSKVTDDCSSKTIQLTFWAQTLSEECNDISNPHFWGWIRSSRYWLSSNILNIRQQYFLLTWYSFGITIVLFIYAGWQYYHTLKLHASRISVSVTLDRADWAGGPALRAEKPTMKGGLCRLPLMLLRWERFCFPGSLLWAESSLLHF